MQIQKSKFFPQLWKSIDFLCPASKIQTFYSDNGGAGNRQEAIKKNGKSFGIKYLYVHKNPRC